MATIAGRRCHSHEIDTVGNVFWSTARPFASSYGILPRLTCTGPLAASIADIVGPSSSLWGLKRDNSVVRSDAQQARPSVLHLFSSLFAFIRCYTRLKHSIPIFHSSYHLKLSHLLFSLWQHPQHRCSRALLEQVLNNCSSTSCH